MLVAVEADVPHLGRGHHFPDTLHHAQPGAQHGHEANLFGQLVASRLGQGGLNGDATQRQVGGSFIGQEDGQLAHQLTKLLRLGAGVSQKSQLVLDKGVLRWENKAVVHVSSRRRVITL